MIRASILALALALAALATPAHAYYTTQADWLAAAPQAEVVTLPAHTAIAQDAYTTYENGIAQVVMTSLSADGAATNLDTRTWTLDTSSGQAVGAFECHSFRNPCFGVYRIIYTLPFDVIGIAGSVQFVLDTSRTFSLSFFDVTQSSLAADFTAARVNLYTGYYGATFAPTNTISVEWSAGLASLDYLNSGFRLTNAQVMRATEVPEPMTLGLFLLGLAGLSIMRSSRASSRCQPRP